ncbi:Fc receptor-like protein 5 [Rhinichthys klamathensis goyatoka]|uniref:Fc receptor-like protein 5 n=1 Tax=Rhinichthys klamathensis goyatoka TaxID=3034132 RepID=UPI0024B5657B|nr:Fc receptor-like protein 5 [Rhinichthys klamathensis goyatoka]
MSLVHSGLSQVKPVVTVKPDQRVFSGEIVNLTCDIQREGNIQWRYSWIKDRETVFPFTSETAAEFSFTADVSRNGKYSCRGESSDSQRSGFSDAVTLTVSDVPTSTVTVTPGSPVFTGETVNLKCVINSDHSNWRYEWYKDSVKLQKSERYTVNRDTVTIRGATKSDQGQYWCRGHIDGRPISSTLSYDVSLSVKDLPTSTVTVTPGSPVFTGETVTNTLHSIDSQILESPAVSFRRLNPPEVTFICRKRHEALHLSKLTITFP